MDKTSILLAKVEAGLLTSSMFEIDRDQALDQRDAPIFDREWMRANALTSFATVSSEAQAAIDKLREVAFKKTYALTRDPEWSGYVSDDFGLLGLALQCDLSDAWLNALWMAYAAGEFPRGELQPIPGKLSDLILR